MEREFSTKRKHPDKSICVSGSDSALANDVAKVLNDTDGRIYLAMKDMKLAMKMALGFGVLIVIAVLLGGIAVWNMRSVQDYSTRLDYQYLPEVSIASHLERQFLETMYEMRGY